MSRLRPVLFVLALVLSPAAASARNVWFVDNSAAADGDGTAVRPLQTLASAQRLSHAGDVIYVAEGRAAYDENVTLKTGQLLIGSAYGLDVARVDFGMTDVSAPPAPRVQGPGPTIHGSIWLAGRNVVAGLTVAADSASGIAISSPQGAITIRNVYVRVSQKGSGIFVQYPAAAVTIEGGGLTSAGAGAGIVVDGGSGNVTVDHFPIEGSFSTAVLVRNRAGGAVAFRRGSRVDVSDALRDAVVVTGCGAASVTFDDPLHVVTHGGRGVVVANSRRVVFGSADNRIEAVDAAAIDFRDSTVEASFQRVTASGHLADGVAVVHVNGHLAIAGGTIRNAGSYGLRIEQSENVHVTGMIVADSGTTGACAENLQKEQNVRCRAGMFLRHVSRSRFENIEISGGSGAGVNANNVSDLAFDGLQISGSGESSTDAALVLQEVSGTISCSRCRLTDGGGGEVIAEQRFNSGRIVFDGCTFGAPKRPGAAPFLVRVLTAGRARLDVDVRGGSFEDADGGAVSVDAADSSSASTSITDAVSQRLGRGILAVAGHGTAQTPVAMHGTRVIAPGVRGGALVRVTAGDAATACVDLSGNVFTVGSGAFPVRIGQQGLARVTLVSPDDAGTIATEGNVSRAAACP